MKIYTIKFEYKGFKILDGLTLPDDHTLTDSEIQDKLEKLTWFHINRIDTPVPPSADQLLEPSLIPQY